MSSAENEVAIFVSSFILCLPLGVMLFIEKKLQDRAEESGDSSVAEKKIDKIYSIFQKIYICYFVAVACVAILVAIRMSDIHYMRSYMLPLAASITTIIINSRGRKSSEALNILTKVVGSLAAYSRKTGITGVQLSKEKIPKDWPSYALFLRSFRLEQKASNPFVVADLAENRREEEFTSLIQKELNLFVLGLGRQEVVEGAARIQLPDGLDWKATIMCLAIGSEVIFIWPGATDGTIWEIDVCLSHFRQKAIFYAPKLDKHFPTDEDEALRTECFFLADALRQVGYETPAMFEESTFWIYGEDKTFRTFTTAAASYAHVLEL